MTGLPQTPDLEAVAARLVWFKPPAEALRNPWHFLAHFFAYGTPEDARTVRRHVSDDILREALDHAPPGIIDPRSWAYWNLILDRDPESPPPGRRFESGKRRKKKRPGISPGPSLCSRAESPERIGGP